MSENDEVTFRGSQDTTPGEGQATGEAGKQPLSESDLVAKLEGMVKAVVSNQLDEHDRKQQGLRARQENRVKKYIAAAKAQGVEVSEAQALALLTADPEAGEGETNLATPAGRSPAPAATDKTDGSSDVDKTALQLMAAVLGEGGKIVRSDPEFATVKTDGTEQEYLQSVTQAALAKKARLSGQSIPAAAKLPGAGSGGLTANKAALTAELEELVKHPSPANLARMRELREKLSKM